MLQLKSPLGITSKHIWVVEFSPSGEARAPYTHDVYRCATCGEEIIFLRK